MYIGETMSKKKNSKKRAYYKREKEENDAFMNRLDQKNWSHIEKKIKKDRGW